MTMEREKIIIVAIPIAMVIGTAKRFQCTYAANAVMAVDNMSPFSEIFIKNGLASIILLIPIKKLPTNVINKTIAGRDIFRILTKNSASPQESNVIIKEEYRLSGMIHETDMSRRSDVTTTKISLNPESSLKFSSSTEGL